MSKLTLLFALVLVVLAFTAVHADEFESELAAEVPEFAEHSAQEFMTLTDMQMEVEPEQSFAEISAETEAEDAAEADAEQENESELESESESESEEANEEEPALIEESAETEVEIEGERKPVKPWHRNNKNQPVARNNAEITCLDGDCTRATKVRKAKVGSHPNASTKPPPTKLDIALGAVKEEIMVRAKELHLEKNWSSKVAKLIDDYQQKLNKVTGNIVLLRTQTKALLRKKKQIQNVQVQNKLRYKLKLAQSDLNRLQKQMEHIAGKENEFTDTEKQLKGTMNALKNSLLKLRGQEPQKLVAEGIELP